VTSDELFTPLGLDQQDLEAPGSRIPVSTASAVIRRARLLTGEPALGIHIGLQFHPIALGYLGFASMSAASLGQCIDLIIRFGPALTTAVSLRLVRTGEIAGLVVDEHFSLHPSASCADADRGPEVASTIAFGLYDSVIRDGTRLVQHAVKFQKIGANKHELIEQFLGLHFPADVSYDPTRDLDEVAAAGIHYLRVRAASFAPSQMTLWRTNPSAYWATFDS
jgi:hypothetical protein